MGDGIGDRMGITMREDIGIERNFKFQNPNVEKFQISRFKFATDRIA
jgi:hypothetical protein